MADTGIGAFRGKFNRRYTLKLETIDNKIITIESPITLQFQVTRNNLASANTANFTIYNLGANIRNQIYKDQFDTSIFRAIQLFAGYDDGASGFSTRVFNGFIKMAASHREGPDWKTEIEAYDSYVTPGSNVSTTLPSGTTATDAIKALMGSFSNIKEQVIGSGFTDQSKRGMALMGDPMDILRQITQDKCYIDDQKAYALGEKDVVPSEIRIFSSDNGLLNTPRKYQNLIEIEALFEPRIKPSQLLELKSTGEPRFNGVYKVTGITHKGTISGAISGDCKTTLQMILIKGWTVVYDRGTNTYIAGAPK